MKTILVGGLLIGLLASVLMAEGEQFPGGERQQRDSERRPQPGSPEEMFRHMDRDGDGKISKREFFAAPRMKNLPEEKREAVFGRLDSDGDGCLSGEEIRAMRHQAERRGMEGFRKLDTDGSGGVSFEEFSKGELSSKLPEEKRQQVFKRMDTDGNGEINGADKPKGSSTRPFGKPGLPIPRPEHRQ